jgi:hypothetical protein
VSDLSLSQQQNDFTPWARLREEGEFEYAHFQLWLKLDPRPQPLDPALAIRHNWSERAAAFDSYAQLQGLSPREVVQNVFALWSTTVLNETRKWFGKSLRHRDEPVLEPKAIGEYLDIISDPARNQAGKQTHDLSGLSPEELQQFLALLEKVETKQ